MQVQEIMTRGATVVNPNMMVRDVAQQMRRDDIGALPVGENDRLIGMVTDRDIVMRAVAADRPASNTAVREVMSDHVYYCFEDDDVDRAAEIMAQHQVRRLPVLNRDKRLVGVVALADIGRTGDPGSATTALKGVSKETDRPRQ